MQGVPLTMIAYGIGILPLIKYLKREIPDVTQPWYADNAGALGKLARLETCFCSIIHQGPGREYYPKPSKSIVILRLDKLESRKCLSDVTDLRYARAHVILGVALRTKSPNTIG